jgi:hypothetical protein
VEYGESKSSIDDIYFELFVIADMIEAQSTGSVSFKDFDEARSKYAEWIQEPNAVRSKFDAFKLLSTQEIHAKVKLNRSVPQERQVSELFKLKVARFNRIQNATYTVLLEGRVVTSDTKTRRNNPDLVKQDRRSRDALRSLFSEIGWSDQTLYTRSRSELFESCPDGKEDELTAILEKMSGVRYEKVYLMVRKQIKTGSWTDAINKIASSISEAVKVTITGNRTVIVDEDKFEEEMKRFRQARREQLSFENLFKQDGSVGTTSWIVPSGNASARRSLSGLRAFDDNFMAAKPDLVFQVLSGKSTFELSTARDSNAKLWAANYFDNVDTGSGLLWSSVKDTEAEIDFTKIKDITTDSSKEQYYTSWNITRDDFIYELCRADSVISDEELKLLNQYSAAPSRANELRVKQLALAGSAL